MGNNHTPGPWGLGKNGSVVTQTPDYQVRHVGDKAEDVIKYYGGHLICESVTVANAMLISAAPDLLEACEAMIKATDAQQMKSELPKVRKAIDKARGWHQ